MFLEYQLRVDALQGRIHSFIDIELCVLRIPHEIECSVNGTLQGRCEYGDVYKYLLLVS